MKLISIILKYFSLNDFLQESYDPFNLQSSKNDNTNRVIEPYVNKYMTNYIKKDDILNYIILNKSISTFLSNNYNKHNESDFFNKYKKVGALAQIIDTGILFDTNIYFVDQNKLYVSSGRSQWIAQYDNNEIIKTEFNSVDDTMYIYTYHKDKDNIICYEKNNEFYFPNN